MKKKYNLIVAALSACLVFMIACFGWFGNLNLILQDSIYQRPESPDTAIKIIAIDEKTLEKLGAFENWTREPYAELIEVLNQEEYSPKVIGMDILLVSEKGEADNLLAKACEEYGNVVVAENLVFSEEIKTHNGRTYVDSFHINMVETPYSELAKVTDSGFVNTLPDTVDNSIRYTFLEIDDNVSFAAVIAKKAGAEDAASCADKNGGMFVDYTGRPGSYETLSFVDILEGRIPPQAFKDAIVLVGATAAGMGDVYQVPGYAGGLMNGVEIHANIIQGLLEQRTLKPVDTFINAVILALITFVMVVGVSNLKLVWSIMLMIAAVCVHVGICFWLDEKGIVVHVLAPVIASIIGVLWSIIGKYVAERIQKRKIMQAFQKYVAPEVVAEIASKHDFKLSLGGEKRHVAVLFVDVRGFTTMSESLEPEQVVEILNVYLSHVTDTIFKYGGTLDKFIGDAAMAIFNAPFDCEDYIYKAVCTAKDIVDGIAQMGPMMEKRFGRQIACGVGVHCGNAVVGNIGSEFRMDYTAIGDTVNTAARLESNAGAGQVYISEDVYEALKERIEVKEAGRIPLKGKTSDFMVYSLQEIKGREA